jgi:hypothetical protein
LILTRLLSPLSRSTNPTPLHLEVPSIIKTTTIQPEVFELAKGTSLCLNACICSCHYKEGDEGYKFHSTIPRSSPLNPNYTKPSMCKCYSKRIFHSFSQEKCLRISTLRDQWDKNTNRGNRSQRFVGKVKSVIIPRSVDTSSLSYPSKLIAESGDLRYRWEKKRCRARKWSEDDDSLQRVLEMNVAGFHKLMRTYSK